MQQAIKNWRQYFPYTSPREIQAQALDVLAANWADYDVFVISAPTAFGKTALSRTLMSALHQVSCITPTNLLVDQFLQEFPDTPTLSRLDAYHCQEWDRPCPITRSKLHQFCRGGVCPASRDLSTAKYRRGPGIYNYHTYLAHKLYRQVLVVDEAHNLIPVIQDRMSLVMWSHDYQYPHNMRTPEQVEQWVSGLSSSRRKNKKTALLLEAVTSKNPRYTMHRTEEWFSGKGTVRGEPELRDCIRLLPVDISDAPPLFWPSQVEKIVLLSATIGPKDLEVLGLGGRGRHRKILYIDCESPIPATNRPIIPLSTAAVYRNNMEQVVPLLAQEIDSICRYHAGERGIIHATYQLAELLRMHLTGDTYIFHTRENKNQQYQLYRTSSEPRVLVASGMYEGIDLPEDMGRFQVIAKIPWASLGNPAVRRIYDTDRERYTWECLRTTIQACGRICRTPEDYGITYILDSTLDRLLSEADHMIPDWFRNALPK